MAKFAAVNINFTPEVGKKEPGRMGTAFHYAAQHLVRLVHIEKTHQWDDLELLRQLWDEGYVEAFGTWDRRSRWYTEGWELLQRWHARTDLSGVEVLSVEEKRRTPVPSALYDKHKPSHKQHPRAAVVPLSYIWDRADFYVDEVTGNRIVKVVDYKTQRKYMRSEDLKAKLQCQIYAMCAMIYFRDRQVDEIWVELEMIRFEPVRVRFTVPECVEIWKDLRRELQRILDTDEKKKLPRTLGPGCRYCPVSATCPELKKNVGGGGILSLSLEEKLALRVELGHKMKTESELVKQIDEFILTEAAERDEIEFLVGESEVKLKQSSRRKLDQQRALRIMGPELYAKYAPLTVEKFEELLKGDELTVEQKEQMNSIVSLNFSEKVTVEVELAGEAA